MEASQLMHGSSQRNNLIKVTKCDETKKMAHDSQIARAEENFKLSYGGPCQVSIFGIWMNQCLYVNQRHTVFTVRI